MAVQVCTTAPLGSQLRAGNLQHAPRCAHTRPQRRSSSSSSSGAARQQQGSSPGVSLVQARQQAGEGQHQGGGQASAAPPAAHPSTPPAAAGQLAQRRALGAALLAATGCVCYATLSQQQQQLPPLPPWVGVAALALPASCGAALLLLWLLLPGRVHLEWHAGRLYLQVGVPSQGPPIPPGAVVVRPTGDARGNGAFAAQPIPAGSYICDYEGERLSGEQYDRLYSAGASDFVMALDSATLIDATPRVADTAHFSGVHMNHSRRRANVGRYYQRGAGRVSFFATRDIEAGDELLYNYGSSYWRGREHLELP